MSEMLRMTKTSLSLLEHSPKGHMIRLMTSLGKLILMLIN